MKKLICLLLSSFMFTLPSFAKESKGKRKPSSISSAKISCTLARKGGIVKTISFDVSEDSNSMMELEKESDISIFASFGAGALQIAAVKNKTNKLIADASGEHKLRLTIPNEEKGKIVLIEINCETMDQ